METVRSSEMLINIYHTAQSHITEDNSRNIIFLFIKYFESKYYIYCDNYIMFETDKWVIIYQIIWHLIKETTLCIFTAVKI
jgi:hypothetical protein